MLTVVEEITLPVGADDAWAVVGDFMGFVEAIGVPATAREEEGHQLRVVSLPAGDIIERLEARDDSTRTFSYFMDAVGPLPLSGYRGVMKVEPEGAGSRVVWTATFEAAGVDDSTADATMHGVLSGGLAKLREHFSA